MEHVDLIGGENVFLSLHCKLPPDNRPDRGRSSRVQLIVTSFWRCIFWRMIQGPEAKVALKDLDKLISENILKAGQSIVSTTLSLVVFQELNFPMAEPTSNDTSRQSPQPWITAADRLHSLSWALGYRWTPQDTLGSQTGAG